MFFSDKCSDSTCSSSACSCSIISVTCLCSGSSRSMCGFFLVTSYLRTIAMHISSTSGMTISKSRGPSIECWYSKATLTAVFKIVFSICWPYLGGREGSLLASSLRASSKMKVSGKQYSRRSFFPMSDVTARPTMRFSARRARLLSIDFLAAFTSAFAVDASSTELSVILEPPSLMHCSWRDRLSAKSVPGIPDIGGNEELWRSARSQLARSRSSSA
mmetsp:Transcript_19379/g.46507  ORF Transcript_19379/g.46507 Transcript_19379/m.46507 type:complete len:217 (-) Transcript_19379:840-1490(-)